MLRLIKVELHFPDEGGDFFVPILERHYVAEDLFILEHQNLVLETWADYMEEAEEFALPLVRRISCSNSMPNLLLQLKR